MKARAPMKNRWLFCLSALLLACAITSQTFAASASPQKVVITPASFSEREGMLVIAHQQGFFRKYNLEAQLVLMPNGPLALSVLTAGDSQFYYGTTSGASLGAVLNGLSGGNWMFTMLAFEHWGIEPKRDGITFRVIGDTGARVQAIATGVIDGSMMGYTHAALLKRQGYPILADVAELNIPFQDSGLFTRKSVLVQHPETVENVLRALLDSIAFIQEPENKTTVMKTLAQWLRLPKPDDALEGYDFMRKMYTRRIYPNLDGIRNSIRVLTLTNEKFGRLKAEDLVDDRVVRKLEKEGLF